MTKMNSKDGILDLYLNPFANNWDWVIQSHGLTPNRQNQLNAIFGKSEESILKIRPVNYGKYVAFVAIRWGFAKMENGLLTPNEKWHNQSEYNKFGEPI